MESVPRVSIAIKRNQRESLSTALSRLPSPLYLTKKIDRVVIKPSIYNPQTPGNTSLDIMHAAIRMFRDIAPIQIVESDNPLRSAEEAFRLSSYKSLLDEGVSLVGLTEAKLEPIEMPGNLFESLLMPTMLSGSRLFVNIGTLKVYPEVGEIGAGLKNLFGLIPECDKSIYHSRLDDALIDLVTVYRPDLTVMDLTEIVIGNREDRNTKRVNAVVVGEDPV
ncbi:MAG: DUF362 domain-containing protein, partial [Candidatus Thorarchaeota archaeon]